MTTIPVLWVSLHDDVLARGYWDQALLEAILDRSLWQPQDALVFEHREVRSLDDLGTDGAVVILASRHHVDDVIEIGAALDRLSWSVVLLTSEEEWRFYWQLLSAEPPGRVARPDLARRLWVWQGVPEQEGHATYMPCGWYPQTRELLAPYETQRDERPLDWFFAGQDTHVRRHAFVTAGRRSIENADHNGYLATTEGYLQEAVTRDENAALLSSAKFVPCPSGPASLCTARVEEALEAGAVPILDLLRPDDPQYDYWHLLFGPDYPMPTISQWDDLDHLLDELLPTWAALSNRCSAFWQQWKRDRALRLDDDVRTVSGLPRNSQDPNDTVTVIVPTSPTERHPSFDHIGQTLASIREQLPTAEIIVVADGVRPEQEKWREQYEHYQRRLFGRLNDALNMVPVRLDEWGHQANATRAALELVRTPHVLFVEHDTPLVGRIDWTGLCDFLATGAANAVRFHFDVAIHPDHEAGMLDHETQWGLNDGCWVSDAEAGRPESTWGPVPVRRTKTWWQRPHLASTRFYRERIMPNFSPESRTMIEDRMHGIVATDHVVNGDAAWWDWRLWVYTPDDDRPGETPLGIKRSAHLDSRGPDEPKYEMKFT